MSEPTYCAYEHCQRPIEVIPGGHRRREYCNDTCRQAALRLRRSLELREKQARISRFRSTYQSPRLRAVLEHVLQDQGEAALRRLIVAIDEERQYVQATDEMQQRVAYLEIKLTRYREIVDLEDRVALEQQFMVAGQLIGYQAIPRYRIGEGIQRWEDYRSWTDDFTLAEMVVYAREVLSEGAAARESAVERSKLRQAEQEMQALRQCVVELETERTAWIAWKEAEIVLHTQLTAMRRYLQEHADAAIPIVRNGVTLKVVALGNDGLAVTEDHGLVRLSDDESEQGRRWVAQKTGVPVIATRLPIGEAKRDGRPA